MKLSVAISGKDAMPSTFVVWRGFEESIRKASEYGYHGVELALKTAEEIEPAALSQWLGRHGMEVSCISTGQVYAALDLYFTHPDKEIREKVIGVFTGLIELAADFGGLVNIGRARGFIGKGQTPGEAEALFADTADRICGIAGKKGVSLVLEPVNRYEINFINNLDEGRQLLARLNFSNLGLMPDVFHMNIEDDRLGDSLARNASKIRYIHLADSNRLAPGSGHIDFREVFEGLKAAEFDGWAAIEILPVPDPDTAARSAAEYILPMLEHYNKIPKHG